MKQLQIFAMFLALTACSDDGIPSPRPWEKVDAFFYPDKTDLTKSIASYDVTDVDACRLWAQTMANQRGDSGFAHSDYECGIGRKGDVPGTYRVTTR
jgi:hypothetical protein